jgi:hypothetical protein
VPIALLRSSSRRSRSIFITFEVTTFGYRRGKIRRERAISLMSCLIPTYTIYGLLSTASSLGVRHTGPTGQTASLWRVLRRHLLAARGALSKAFVQRLTSRQCSQMKCCLTQVIGRSYLLHSILANTMMPFCRTTSCWKGNLWVWLVRMLE